MLNEHLAEFPTSLALKDGDKMLCSQSSYIKNQKRQWESPEYNNRQRAGGVRVNKITKFESFPQVSLISVYN